MTQGFVTITEVKCLLVGPAGVLKFLLLSKPPPTNRTSTACQDRPVRVVRVGKLEDKWKEIDISHLRYMIAQSIPLLIDNLVDVSPENLLSSMDSCLSTSTAENRKSGTALPKACVSETAKLPRSAHTTSPVEDTSEEHGDYHVIEGESHEPSSDPTVQVYSLIMEHLAQREKKKGGLIESLFNTQLIYFIDSGGQAAFHDLLPLFVSNTTAAIFVHRLCESLDDFPADDFFKDGKKVGPSMKASATNIDILKCMAQTLYTQLHEGKLPIFLNVGTHLDLEKPDTREEKNRRIKEILKPLFPDQLQYSSDELNPIFAVNTGNPKEEDHITAGELRKAIEGSAVTKNIPIRWFVLELIIAALSEKVNRNVLSYEECLKEANKLQIFEEPFKAALSYLHNLNLILYYPEFLPNVVFSDAHVPVTILSSLVWKWYDLIEVKPKTRPPALRNVSWEKFRDQGIISEEILSTIEFKGNFTKGFFSPQDFLKLLQGVLAANPLNDMEYFVPAFTSRLSLPKLTNYLQSQQTSTSFAICFKNGCAAAGVFCCSIVHLQVYSQWKLIVDGRKPLARNCMQFELPYSISIVTLVDHFTFFRVCLDTPKDEEKTVKEVFSSVRNDFFKAIIAAGNNLKYAKSIPFVGFQCLHNDDYHRENPHTVTIKRMGYWMCPKNQRVSGKLTDTQSLWLQESC